MLQSSAGVPTSGSNTGSGGFGNAQQLDMQFHGLTRAGWYR